MTVSVVIPAYNAGACLQRAIESVLEQTVAVDEVLVVDDGSTDDTRAVAEAFGGRVRVRTQKNQGASAARNAGVEAAGGELIAFLDADDQWHPEKIEKQLKALAAAPGAVLCYTSLTVLEPDGSRAVQRACAVERLKRELRVGNPRITPTCVLLSRRAFLEAGGFLPEQVVCEDWDLWVRMLAQGPFCVVDEPVVYYHAHNSGLSSDADELYREARRMVDGRLLEGLTGLERMHWRRRIMSYQAFRSAMTARSRGERAKEWVYQWASVGWWPSPLWYPVRFKSMLVTGAGAFVQGWPEEPSD